MAMKRLALHRIIPLLAGVALAISSISPTSAAFAYPPVPECSEADIIINGSFEDPVVINVANWDIFGPKDFILGWQANWTDAVPDTYGNDQKPYPKIELQKGVNGWVPKDGNQWTELDTDWVGPDGALNGEPASIDLWQSLSTVIGAQYQIKFWTSPRPGVGSDDNITEVKWGYDTLDTITEDGSGNSNTVWTEHIYTAVAVASTTKLMFTDLGTANSLGGFIDKVSVSRICEEEPEDPCDFGDQTGWHGEYFNYSRDHSDMNLLSNLWPDKTHGDPMSGVAPWTADWYTEQYARFSQVDSDLTFGGNFFPFDPPKNEEIDNGHDYHFGAHWSAKVSGNSADHPFTLKTDDDAWVYLNGELVADNSGIHPPATINGTMNFGETPVIVDIYFAERHVVQSHMYFAFTSQDDHLWVQPYNRDCVQPVPALTLEKTGEYDAGTNQINYAIDWNITGEGTLYDVTITDSIPTGTTFMSADNSGTELGGIVTWLLGAKTALDSGTVNFVVSVDSAEAWADSYSDFNQGLRKDGSPVLAERSDPEKALGEAEDDDTVNFVSLGFGGSLVLHFDNYILDGTGPDIHVVETSFGNPTGSSYPEKVEVLASQNGSTWVSLGTQTRSEIVNDNDFDLDGQLPWAKYLKLVDKTDPASFAGDTDGYDIDGVQALHSAPSECSINNTAHISGLTFDQQVVEADGNTATSINEFACEPEEENVTIIAHKIVCDLEAELPNWGDGGENIDANTAQDWVDSHRTCRFVEDWEFQWGPVGAYDPGDTLIGPANAPWQTMTPTDANGMTTTVLTAEDIAGSSYLWFREVLKEGYIPFTYDQNGDTNADPVSAEMYCHIDVLNYDNYDRIDGVELGQTYNCVGFNTPSRQPSHTVSGMKFNDKNGDGTKDEGDNGLNKWVIYASKLVDTIQVEAHNTLPTSPEFLTDELDNGKEYILRVSGTYDANDGITADAKYSFRVPNSTEWTDIVKNYESYGATLLDLFVDDVAPNWGVFNPSHVYWRTIAGTGAQVKLQIYEIYAQNDSGALTVDVYEVVDKQITDDEGNYQFTFPEDIGEVMISEETQDGWLETLPSPDGYYMVFTDENYEDKDFGNHYTIQIPGTVTGMKFNDHNGDGVKGDNDAGLADWTIYAGKLVDTIEVDAHSLREDGNGETVQSHIVLANGQKYIMRATGTFSAGDSITADAQYSIRTGPEWTDLVENYGGWGVELLDLWINSDYSLWGSFNPEHVYWHTEMGTGNTIGLHIYDIFASNNAGGVTAKIYEVLAETVTGGNGSYSLDIPAELTGDVIIAEETQLGWFQTYPMPEGYHVVSADGLTENINFGNHDITEQNDPGDGDDPEVRLGSIAGIKFNDHDGNGVKDVNDEPLSGWTIYLDLNDNGALDNEEPSMVTLGDGSYAFTELSSRLYVVREIPQSDWDQTLPTAAHNYAYGLTITDVGENYVDINFGNKPGGVTGAGESSGGGSGGGGYYTPPATEPTGGSGEDDGTGDQDDDVAGDTDEQSGDTTPPAGSPTAGTPRGGGSQVALGDGDQGGVEDQGDILGDADANDTDQTDDKSGTGGNGWTVLGWILIPLLLLLILIYLIYRWLNRKKGGSNNSGMTPPVA